MAKHVHAEIIKAWADGAEIEHRFGPTRCWSATGEYPVWHKSAEYRVKPVPHKWQAVIDAWNAGKAVQWMSHGDKVWYDSVNKSNVMVGQFNHDGYDWRIKPENVVQYWYFDTRIGRDVDLGEGNLKLTFEDGKLITAEVLK